MNRAPSCVGNDLSLTGEDLVGLLRVTLDRGLSLRFRARGSSMSPFIKDGDALTISPLLGASPRLGDVVAFRCPSTRRLLIHRTVGKRGALYVMQGDNAIITDGIISEEDIIGYITKVERGGKGVLIGLGAERSLIAFLTQKRILSSFLRPFWRFIRSPLRRNKTK